MRILILMTLSAVAFISSAVAATVIPVASFDSIALSDGGRVVVRYGPVQRVTMIQGDPQFTRVRVDDQRLVIDNAEGRCPRGYKLEIEVVTPQLSALSVSNGGTVQTAGAFPGVASLALAVEQGGTIDARSIVADRVNAAVDQGGRILTTARNALRATVDSGGVITYWGDVRDVRETVDHGGVVSRGAARDATKALSDFGPDHVLQIPPVPPVPPRNP